jgi:hypothetical protein
MRCQARCARVPRLLAREPRPAGLGARAKRAAKQKKISADVKLAALAFRACWRGSLGLLASARKANPLRLATPRKPSGSGTPGKRVPVAMPPARAKNDRTARGRGRMRRVFVFNLSPIIYQKTSQPHCQHSQTRVA